MNSTKLFLSFLDGEYIISSSHGGKVWNVSSLTGWLSSQCLCAPATLTESKDSKNFNCVAVITEVNMDSPAVMRIHPACGGLVALQSALAMCTMCAASPLMEQKMSNSQVSSCFFSLKNGNGTKNNTLNY